MKKYFIAAGLIACCATSVAYAEDIEYTFPVSGILFTVILFQTINISTAIRGIFL